MSESKTSRSKDAKSKTSIPKDALSLVFDNFENANYENVNETLEEYYPHSPISELSAELYDAKSEEFEDEDENVDLDGSDIGLEKGLFEKTIKFVNENKAKLDQLKVPEKDLDIFRRRRQVVSKPKRPQILNTFRKMSVNPFDADVVQAIVHLVFQRYLHEDQRYPKRASKANRKALQLSSIIRDTIKKFRFERFKTACLVELLEKSKLDESNTFQTPSYMSGYIVLHDTRQDKVVSATWESKYLVCSCIVFGFYAE